MLEHLPLHAGFDERADSPPVLDPAIEPTLVGQFLASCEAAPASAHGRTASSGKPAASHRTASHRIGLRPATHRSGAHHATSDGRRGLLAAKRHVAVSVLHTGLNDPLPDRHSTPLEGRVVGGVRGDAHRNGEQRSDGERQQSAPRRPSDLDEGSDLGEGFSVWHGCPPGGRAFAGDRASMTSETLSHGAGKVEPPQGVIKIPCLTAWLRPMGRPDDRGVFRYLPVLSSTVDPPAFFWIDAIASCADFFCL